MLATRKNRIFPQLCMQMVNTFHVRNESDSYYLCVLQNFCKQIKKHNLNDF